MNLLHYINTSPPPATLLLILNAEGNRQKRKTPLGFRRTGSFKRLRKTGKTSIEEKRVERDARRTSQMLEAVLLIKLYRKRSIGWQISLGEPIMAYSP
jgi:hypothetical protein